MPFATTGFGESREINVFDVSGNLRKKFRLPSSAARVAALSWPKRGNLLVGSGSWVGVLDPDGAKLLSHVIDSTSFDPYHGPDGTAVRLDPSQEPFLAVMSHGSSGYPRSVLLVFDPKGRLVWQEEMNRLDAILALPRSNGKGEVLLVGGMDGVAEYSLAATPARGGS